MNANRLLLDTHIWLWAVADPEQLHPRVVNALEEPTNEVWLSPVSVWETMLLLERGRVEVDTDPRLWIDQALRTMPVRDAVLNREVAMASRVVVLRHEDPADRFIAATAQVYDLTLVTADRRLTESEAIEVLPNR